MKVKEELLASVSRPAAVQKSMLLLVIGTYLIGLFVF